MYKMMITEKDFFITNDVVEILERIQMKHPIASILADMVKTQEEISGDGEKTALMLALKLLQEAKRLKKIGIHQTTICEGFKIAENELLALLDRISLDLPLEDETLKKIALTALGKNLIFDKERLATQIVGAINFLDDNLDISDIKILRQIGFGIPDSELIHGLVIKKEIDGQKMRYPLKNAKILVFKKALDINRGEIYLPTIMDLDSSQIKDALQKEKEYLRNIITRIISSGANIIFCEKAVDDFIFGNLLKNGIFVLRRISDQDIRLIAKASGAQIISDLRDIDNSKLGFAEVVEERKIGDDVFVYILGCKNQKVSSIIIKGSENPAFKDGEKHVKNSLHAVRSALENGRVCVGGGAAEIELARRLREFAVNFTNRVQLVVDGFANTVEAIPCLLAENSGLDPLDYLIKLRGEHNNGKQHHGININTGKIEDLFEAGIFEPIQIKKSAIHLATEAAQMLIKIDVCLISAAVADSHKEKEDAFKTLEQKPTKKRKWKQSPVLIPR